MVYTLGASGAVYGLFVAAVLLRAQFNWYRVLEFVILGNFVIQRLMEEVRNQVAMGGSSGVSHLAHIGGATIGVLLILGLKRIVM